MLSRRSALVSALPAVLATDARAAGSFEAFVAGVYNEAMSQGIRRDVLDAAFAGVTPNQKVIDRDRKQAEFTMTWAQDRARVITGKRITDGRATGFQQYTDTAQARAVSQP